MFRFGIHHDSQFVQQAATQPVTSELLQKHGVLCRAQTFGLSTVVYQKGFVGQKLKVLKETAL